MEKCKHFRPRVAIYIPLSMARRQVSPDNSARRKDAAAAGGDVEDVDDGSRRVSLASRIENLSRQGAFSRAVKDGRPEVAACRAILQKPQGKRALEDIDVVCERACRRLDGTLQYSLCAWDGCVAEVAVGVIEAALFLCQSRRM